MWDWLKELGQNASEFDLSSVFDDGNMSEAAFNAADAANLTSQGIGESAVAQNLGQAGVGDASFMAADAADMQQFGMSQEDIAKNLASEYPSASDSGFDAKGLAKGLGEGLSQVEQNAPKAPKAPGGSIVQPIKMVGGPGGAPQPVGAAINYGSPAMQTIQNQNLAAVPSIQDVIKMRQMRGM